MMTELIVDGYELASQWMGMLLLATWRTLPLLALVACIGLALRRRAVPSLLAVLWTLVIARLLLPVSISSPFSVHGAIDRWFAQTYNVLEPPTPALLHGQALDALAPSSEVLWWSSPVQAPVEATMRSPALNWEATIITLAVACLFLVSLGLVTRQVVSHVRFAWLLRRSRVIDDQSLIDLLLRECDSLSVGRRPELREVETLRVPAVFGLVRKTICLPPNLLESLNQQEFRWVIRHELAHIRRYDTAVMVLASLAWACHWFNPLVWIAFGRLRSNMEAAADQLTLGGGSTSDGVQYGKLLLRLAESGENSRNLATLGLLPFAAGKYLKKRVESLLHKRLLQGWRARTVTIVVVTAITLMGLTDHRASSVLKTPEVHLVSSSMLLPDSSSIRMDEWAEKEEDGRTNLRVYDIESIINSMPKFTAVELSPKQQLCAWLPLPKSIEEKIEVNQHKLIAKLSARQHELLAKTLETWKNGEPKQIAIETRFIQSNIHIASSVNWAERRIDNLEIKGMGPVLAARISESELASLVQRVSLDPRTNIMLCPKLTVFDGQLATIENKIQRPFVTGAVPIAKHQLQPIVSVVDEGLSLVVQSNLGDKDQMKFTFRIRASNIGEVAYANLPLMQTPETQQGFTVQVPSSEQYEVSSSVQLEKGESVIVAIPKVFTLKPGADAETTIIVALTPRILAPQAGQ